MDFKNLQYTFEELGDVPFNVVRIMNECWNAYMDGDITQAGEHGDLMASGWMKGKEFDTKINQIGYDVEKYKELKETLVNDVDEHNQHLYWKHYEPSETEEEDNDEPKTRLEQMSKLTHDPIVD